MSKNTAAAADDSDHEGKILFGGLSDEQREDMTDEELAGIDGDDLDDEGDEEEGDEGAEGDQGADDGADDGEGGEDDGEEAGDEDGGEGDAGDDAGDDEGDDEAGDTGGDESADQGDDAGDEADEDGEDDALDFTRSVLPNEWQVPADSEDKIKGLNEQAIELADKFDSGDLTAREYHTQREAIDEQRTTLRSQINDAQKAWGKALNDWSNKTVKAFLRENPQYGAENPTLNRVLDGEVRALQLNTPDPFNPRILREAHANIQKAMGKTVAAEPAPARQAGQQTGKNGKNGKTKPPVVPGKRPQVPPTLARMPADEIEDTSGGKYARLDRLSAKSPHDFEVALSKMSPADRDEYLAGG
jgi:hypothetical protein